MKYNGIELVEVTEPFMDVEGVEMLVWDDNNDDPKKKIVYILSPPKAEFDFPVITQDNAHKHCAHIPQYDKSKFRIRTGESLEEVLKNSEMTEEQFFEFYDEEYRCCGFSRVNNFEAPYIKCSNMKCENCPLDRKNKKLSKAWLKGEDLEPENTQETKQNINLNELAKKAHDTATKRGFFPAENIKTNLFEAIREISEIGDSLRDNKFTPPHFDFFEVLRDWGKEKAKKEYEVMCKNTVEQEFAGSIITLLSIAHELKIDIDSHVKWEMEYNKLRATNE